MFNLHVLSFVSFHSLFPSLHCVFSDSSLGYPSTLHVNVTFVLRCISMWYPSFTYLGSKRCLPRASQVNSLTRVVKAHGLLKHHQYYCARLHRWPLFFPRLCMSCLTLTILISYCMPILKVASVFHCIHMGVSQSQEYLPFLVFFSWWTFAPGKHPELAWLCSSLSAPFLIVMNGLLSKNNIN